MPAVLSDPVADVVAAADKLRVDDRLITSAAMLLGDVEALLGTISTLQAVVVRRLRAAHAIDATDDLYGRSTKRWLVEDLLLADPEAGRLMRLTRRLADHPVTEAAMDAGEISGQHAGTILTALQTLPSDIRDTVEPHLVERARHYPPEEIGGFVDELLQRLGQDKDGDVRRERRLASRGVDIAKTMHGDRSLSGRLTPEVGERFDAALSLAAQRSGPEDDRNPRQRRHDALGVIADTFLGQAEPSFTGAPRTVIVTIDLDTLESQLRDSWLTTPFGVLSAETARRLACDAELIPVVLGANSEVLDIGQADHEFTTPIRRAAYLRDRGRCVFPRCRNRPVELHHIVFRRHRGPTRLDNAAWLCAYHHWLVHEGGWTLQRQPHDGSYLWTNPAGIQWVRHLGTA